MNRATRRPRAAFALAEAIAIVLVVIVLVLLLHLVGARSRRLANLGQDINKLHDIAFGTSLYSAEFKDQIWAFSWQGGVHYNSPWPELNDASSDVQAQSNQAVEILRRRAARTDIPMIGGWIPNILYSHLVLADYLQVPLPWLTAVSSADTDRLRWASDPACFDANCFAPCQQPGSGGNRRNPYGGSFQECPAAWDRSSVGTRVEQAGFQTFFTSNSTRLGPGRLSDVAHPSDKVHVLDEFARHFGHETAVYFAHPEAKLPLLFFDGRAQLKFTRDANPGWRPNHPEDPQPTILQAFIRTGSCTPGVGSTYQDSPPVPSPGVFRWTRSGLAGRDFGPEVWPPAEAPGERAPSTLLEYTP